VGCNCKNKNQEQTKKIVTIPQSDGALEIVEVKEPPYTWEEIIAVKDYLSSRNKTEEGRIKVVEFNKKYFGEIIPGYCDQPCLERTRKRVEQATEVLNKYENVKNK
jgi:hypothetical protein